MNRSSTEAAGKATESAFEFALRFQSPLDWSALLAFLAARATPGVESVEAGSYQRTVSLDGTSGIIEVSRDWRDDCRDDLRDDRLAVRASAGLQQSLPELKSRITHLFDLATDSAAISAHLGRDPILAPVVRAFPGIRVPGSWDPFETAVRAILGQVVSVKAATSLSGRLVARYGEPVGTTDTAAGRYGGDEAEGVRLTHHFPAAERLAEADLGGLGLSGQKIRSLAALARAVVSGSLRFDRLRDLREATEALQELPGIGPWTANYIAMRSLHEPDAFPAGDLILIRAASTAANTTMTARELSAMAESWRPWRAYAAMLLWASYSRSSTKPAEQGERAQTKAAD